MFPVITNHQAQAIARLLSQYKGKETIEGTVSALVLPIQDIEYALDGMNNLRTLEGAQGVQLDLLGAVVGLARVGGQSDDAYRTAIKAKIQENVSQGEAQALIQTFLLLTGVSQVLLDELYPCSLMMESVFVPASVQEAYDIITVLDMVAAGGVRVEGFISYDPDAAFAMDGNLPGAGFGDATDPTAGGLFAELWAPNVDFAFDGDDTHAGGFGDVADPLVGGQFVSL